MHAKLSLVAMSLALCLATRAAVAGTEELSHAIFVKVNGKTITQDNVVQAVKYILKREYKDQMPEDEQEVVNIQKAALRDLVRTILIHDEASRQNVKIGREAMRRIVSTSGLRQEEITPTIRKMLEADDLFEEIMMHAGTPLKEPSPKEVKDFYNSHREEFKTNAFIVVRTIFISVDGVRPQSYFRERAEAILRELEAVPLSLRTEAFAKKAQEVSEDAFARHGGLLTQDNPDPWIPKDFANRDPEGRELLPQPMVDAIRRLNRKGEIRLAVSIEGMHLLYLEDTRGGNVIGWEEASRIIDFVLRQRQKDRLMRTWLNRIFDKSDVRWHDGTAFEKGLLLETLLPSEKMAMGGE